MNIFSLNNYRDALRRIVKERKTFERHFGFHLLADAARIQRPYLSKVIKGTAHLSSDQMYLISTFLKLSDDEHDFLQLLLELERTAVEERRRKIEGKINQIVEKYSESAVHLTARNVRVNAEKEAGMAEYYLDPMVQIVHIALSIDAFSQNPSNLATELKISGGQLHAILATLERLNLAYRSGQSMIPIELNLNLARSSSVYRAWRNQMKLYSLQRINQLNETEAYSFTVVFSANPSTKKIVHARFLEFLKSCEVLVKEAPARQTYQMSFDLFPWTSLK